MATSSPLKKLAAGSVSPAARRLQWAYGLMALVLVLSPIEFLEGVGVSALSPGQWWTPSASWTSAAASAGSEELWAAPSAAAGAAPGGGLAAGNPGRGTGANSSSAPAAEDGSLKLLSLELDPPDVKIYAPEDSGAADAQVLLGGILHLQGMLPYHRQLSRSTDRFCSAKTPGGSTERRQLQTAVDSPGPSGPRSLRGFLGGWMVESLPPRLASALLEPGGQRRRSALEGSDETPPGLVGTYTGWLGKENLGDDIVADIFLDLFAAAVIQATDAGTCVTLERSSAELAERGRRGCTLADSAGCDFGVLGGGSLGW